MVSLTRIALLLWPLLAAAPARADSGADLVSMINELRAHPGCAGPDARPAPPLQAPAALARIHIGPGLFLDQVLEAGGYPVERADVIEVAGATDAAGALAALVPRYCRRLTDRSWKAIGVSQTAGTWQVVLARPAPPTFATILPDWEATGRAILAAINAARAVPRQCGDQAMPAAPPLTWNATLATAALIHSRDMARQRYLAHRGKDGSTPDSRATAAGYAWRTIGENIASGQGSPEEAVAGWLDSPGHCVNLMNPRYTESGVAYAISDHRVLYWTEEFGTPR